MKQKITKINFYARAGYLKMNTCIWIQVNLWGTCRYLFFIRKKIEQSIYEVKIIKDEDVRKNKYNFGLFCTNCDQEIKTRTIYVPEHDEKKDHELPIYCLRCGDMLFEMF